MTVYVSTTADKLIVGDRIKLVENFPTATVTYEGLVRSEPTGTLVDISVDDNDGYTTAYAESQEERNIKVEIWRMVELPTVTGSIIELYDCNRASNVRAILNADGYWLQLFVVGDVSTVMLRNDQVAADFQRVIFVP